MTTKITVPARGAKICPTCGKGFVGRLNQVYCSAACKQYMYRAQKATNNASNNT